MVTYKPRPMDCLNIQVYSQVRLSAAF